MIDDENFNRAFSRRELQPELFLECGENIWEVGVGLAGLRHKSVRIARRLGARQSQHGLIGREVHFTSNSPANPVLSTTGRPTTRANGHNKPAQFRAVAAARRAD
jgi:hypothetical protein